jgi:hypothetical protein
MFWIFFAVFWVCETYLYCQGHDTVLFKHKTPEEKAIRAKQTGLDDESEHKDK